MLIITMIRKIQKPITTVQELCIIGSAAVRCDFNSSYMELFNVD